MENSIRHAFALQKNSPNKKLAVIIQRVEEDYFSAGKVLQDEQLEQVWAAGTGNISPEKEKDHA